jgi:hypothetical protein
MAPTASTTARSFLKRLPLLVLLALNLPLAALDTAGFARSLEAEGDWYRAIGQWKQLRFEATDKAVYWTATQAIVADYWAARQDESGLAELARIEAQLQGADPRTSPLQAWKGLFQYRLSRYTAAEYSWTQARSPLYLGLLYAKTGRGEQAAPLWQGLALPDPTEGLSDSKSPVLAAALSLVLPGSGQVYAGHWFDGAQAAAFVGFFGAAAYGTYLYDSKVSGNYVLTGITVGVAAFFHAANIYGAAKTADYFNQNQTNAQTAGWEKAVFSRPLPDLSLSPSREK